jgi:hypothetical protein
MGLVKMIGRDWTVIAGCVLNDDVERRGCIVRCLLYAGQAHDDPPPS